MKASRAHRVVVPLAIAFLTQFLSSCAPPAAPPQEEPPHYLTVSNNSSSTLCFVIWEDAEGQFYNFAPDQVYDSVLGREVDGMLIGSECRLQVGFGNVPIRFFFAGGGSEYETVESIVIEYESQESSFTFIDSSMVQIRE